MTKARVLKVIQGLYAKLAKQWDHYIIRNKWILDAILAMIWGYRHLSYYCSSLSI